MNTKRRARDFWSGRGSLAIASAVVLAGATALAAVPVAGAASAASSAAWAKTATQGLTMTNATSLGSVGASTPLSIDVVLSVRHPAELKTLAEETSEKGTSAFGEFLTPKEVASRFGPSSSEADAVAAWMKGAGLTDVTVEPDRLFIEADATAATAEKAFDTTLGLFKFDGTHVYANTSAAKVPERFAGVVLSVLGLSDVPMDMFHVVRTGAPSLSPEVESQIKALASSGTPDTSGFTPEQLATVYDGSSLPKATKTSVAIVASGDMTSTISDLRYAEAQNGAPKAAVSVVYTAPEADVVDDNPYTGNLEWDLDTQMSTQIAGNVKHEYIYDIATLDDADVSRAINEFVEQDKAVAGSASLGECDVQPYLDGSMVATDEVLEEGALQGQSFFASSGDNGYACPEVASTGVPGGAPGASWPADGTWTTAVGGTSLLATSAGQYMEEISWIGGGGGISEFETPGNWTSTANPAAAGVEYLPMGGRGEPDIAADADPDVSPVIVWQDETENYVGGTSVSSPLSMGLWARIQTAHSNKLGVASINFYGLYNQLNSTGSEPVDPAGFNDITVGTNGLYTALPGYDLTTGIGSLNAAVLSSELG